MSARWVPVGWNAAKWRYDAALVAGALGYLLLYRLAAPEALDGARLNMQAYGSATFLMLTLVLAIGPAARLDRRFLPVLYNRRHFGVLTCCMALAHAQAVLGWYFAYSPTPSLVALLGADTGTGALHGLPFIPFGILALLILVVLAATSHDFWLAFLGPALWKALHMSLYAGYALAVLHVAFGRLQDGADLALALVVTGSATLLVTLHLLAARREALADAELAPAADAPWLRATRPEAIAEGRAVVVHPAAGEPVAIFRHQGRLSAVSNLCAHQNGPLGEGQVVDGCITCPWHGFQYRLADGCAPPPFTEKLATYRLRLADGWVELDPRPNPPGRFVEPLPA
jgi:nitrite reductase/ring-hydroxylating ferredoxin subunit/DMSO/TMAO reductase YedYZ heme-binding membrane subunit